MLKALIFSTVLLAGSPLAVAASNDFNSAEALVSSAAVEISESENTRVADAHKLAIHREWQCQLVKRQRSALLIAVLRAVELLELFFVRDQKLPDFQIAAFDGALACFAQVRSEVEVSAPDLGIEVGHMRFYST